MKPLFWLAIALQGTLRGFASADAVTAIRLRYVTDAVYVGEKCTLVAEGPVGASVRVVQGDSSLLWQGGWVTNRLEINLFLKRGGLLRVEYPGGAWVFDVVEPARSVRLTEREGWLHTTNGPAILLAQNRFPPRHDRRWEALRLARRIVGDDRPTADCGLLVAAPPFPAPSEADFDRMTGVKPGFWEYVPASPAVYEIDGLLAALDGFEDRSLALVSLSGRDAERGLDPLSFSVKLAWYLQALDAGGRFGLVYLVAPAFNARQRSQFGHFTEACRLVALGNGARPILIHDSEWSGAMTPEVWTRLVMRRLGEQVRIPPSP